MNYQLETRATKQMHLVLISTLSSNEQIYPILLVSSSLQILAHLLDEQNVSS